jgi:hypothetical protein
VYKYFTLLDTNGTFAQLGVPEDGDLIVTVPPVIFKSLTLTGSLIGSPREIREMLDLVAKKRIQPWIQKWHMDEANEAINAMEAGNARYRYVLSLSMSINEHLVAPWNYYSKIHHRRWCRIFSMSRTIQYSCVFPDDPSTGEIASLLS